MFPYILYNHHLGTKLVRENIKREVDLSNYQAAKTELQNEIIKHQSSFGYIYSNRKEKYGERLIMNHSLNHLNAVINKNDPSYIDGNGQVKHQSDIVKSSLQEVPEQNYPE